MSPKVKSFLLHPWRWLPLFCLVYGVTDAAAANLVTITVTVTNPPTTSNTFYTSSSATTRLSIWTNATTTTTIQTNLVGKNESATNLFFHLANYPIQGVILRWLDTNQFSMRGTSLSVTSSVGWCELATNSLAGTNTYSVAIPFDNLALTTRTNEANEISYGVQTYATNPPVFAAINAGESNATVKPIFKQKVSGTNEFYSIELGGGMTGSVMTETSLVLVANSLQITNTVWVSPGGDDATGTRNDLNFPFQTLLNARAAALDGDTVMVLPGIYSQTDSLLKSNVNWHFFPGTYVTNTGGSTALFGDRSLSHIPSRITGWGNFYDSGSYMVIEIISNSAVTFEGHFKAIGGSPAIQLSAGTNSFTGFDEITSTNISVVIGSSATAMATFNNCRLISTNVGVNAPGLQFTVANTNLVLRDCVIVTSGATNSVGHSGSIAPQIRVYGSLMARTNIGPRINFLVGTNRVEVDDDVIR